MRKIFSVLWGVVYPIIGYLVLTILVEFAFFGIYAIVGIMSGTGIPNTMILIDKALIITGIAALITIPIGIWLYVRDEGLMGVSSYDQYRVVPTRVFVICFFGAAGLSILGNILVQLMFFNYNDVDFSAVNQAIYGTNKWITLLIAGIIVPITEELIFRGLVYKRIRRSYGVIPAIILSAVAFGVFHGNLTQGVYAMMLGILLAWAYERTESIVTTILMHQGANILSVILTYAFLSGNIVAIIVVIAITIASVVAMILMLYMLIIYKKQLPMEEVQYEAFKHISPLL